MQAQSRRVQCLSPGGLHHMAYLEWGDPRNPEVVICVHGLTRAGRDFDQLAQTLASRFRVICPDVVGRGASDWLVDPTHYHVPQYVSDMVTLLARLDVPQVRWVGTSMGALIGMALAAMPNSPITRMLINDAGPVITLRALQRIGQYLGKAPLFETFEQAVTYVRTVSAPFGPHSDAQWRFLTEVVVRQNDDGGWRMHYDPRIADAYARALPAQDLALWSVWDAIRCPVRVLRGAASDLLLTDTCVQMQQRGPRTEVIEFAGVGHAPTFLHADQIEAVVTFL